MNTQEYVNSLFSDYEESKDLIDFMEELQSNLEARIANLIRKGIEEKEAFDKACAELGDISALAKELSLKKRREVIEEAYMDIKNYMSNKRVAGYVVFGITALFGIIIAIVGYLAVVDSFHSAWFFGEAWPFGREIGLITLGGILLPFLVTSISGFTFLGLTQETPSDYPMSTKRAAWYTLAAALISSGLILMFVTYFSVRMSETPFELLSALVVLIPFALPGGGLLAFLILTEKSRFKPWAASQYENTMKMEWWNDPVQASRFGMFSGAIWIFAIALFLLLGFLMGFKYSWLVFLFATAIQLLVQGLMMKKKM